MARSNRAQAIDAAFDALAETGIKWRGWGLRTISFMLGGPVDPQFAEWMMGFPLGWTECAA